MFCGGIGVSQAFQSLSSVLSDAGIGLFPECIQDEDISFSSDPASREALTPIIDPACEEEKVFKGKRAGVFGLRIDGRTLSMQRPKGLVNMYGDFYTLQESVHTPMKVALDAIDTDNAELLYYRGGMADRIADFSGYTVAELVAEAREDESGIAPQAQRFADDLMLAIRLGMNKRDTLAFLHFFAGLLHSTTHEETPSWRAAIAFERAASHYLSVANCPAAAVIAELAIFSCRQCHNPGNLFDSAADIASRSWSQLSERYRDVPKHGVFARFRGLCAATVDDQWSYAARLFIHDAASRSIAVDAGDSFARAAYALLRTMKRGGVESDNAKLLESVMSKALEKWKDQPTRTTAYREMTSIKGAFKPRISEEI